MTDRFHEARVERAPDAISRTVAGQRVIVLVPSLQSFELNEVASAIWDLSDGRTVGAIIEGVARAFEVEGTFPEEEIVAFVRDLADAGVLNVHG